MMDLYKPSPRGLRALQQFGLLQRSLRANGAMFVGYRREAYVNPEDDSARVTFDRALCAKPYDHRNLFVTDLHPVENQELGGTILELKYTDRMPRWMQDLIRTFRIQCQSGPKYGLSVESASKPAMKLSSATRVWDIIRYA